LELIPPAFKERYLRLQHENKRLRAAALNQEHGFNRQGGKEEDEEVLETMLDDLREREKSLELVNR